MPMRTFVALLLCLLSLRLIGSAQHAALRTECAGVIHGIATGLDRQPLSHVGVILEPASGNYGYVLPRTNTDQRGEYRFEQVCPGKWGAFVEDEKAGYPYAGRFINQFLYGHYSPPVEITNKQLEAEFNFVVPPKPGQLRVHVTSADSNVKIIDLKIKLTATRKREMESLCSIPEQSNCTDNSALVPPDHDVRLRVTSKGFHEWKAAKLIHLSAGQVMTIDVQLVPLAHLNVGTPHR